MTTTRELYNLQELDWELDSCQARLVIVEAQLKDDSAIVRAQSENTRQKENLRQLRKQHSGQAQKVQQSQEKLLSLEQRLYGGSVRNPRELESLHAENQYAKEQSEKAAEDLLNLMIGMDEHERWVATASEELNQMEIAWRDTLATLTKEQGVLAKQLQGMLEKRQGLVSSISSSLLTQYERLKRSLHGQAVAKVEKGRCAGCRITLPTKELQQARVAREPVACNSCGRLLYMS